MNTKQRINHIKAYIVAVKQEIRKLRTIRTVYHNKGEMKHVNETTRHIEVRKEALAEAESRLANLDRSKRETVLFS